MIQDITPHTYHNEYRPVQPEAESLLLYFEGDLVLVKRRKDRLCFPSFSDLPDLAPKLSEELRPIANSHTMMGKPKMAKNTR